MQRYVKEKTSGRILVSQELGSFSHTSAEDFLNSRGLALVDYEIGVDTEIVIDGMIKDSAFLGYAPDLVTAKAKKKKELSLSVQKVFAKNIDPHYLKYHRKVARGNAGEQKPGSTITDYEDALTANQDTANLAIDALTTIKEVMEYNGMIWPVEPS